MTYPYCLEKKKQPTVLTKWNCRNTNCIRCYSLPKWMFMRTVSGPQATRCKPHTTKLQVLWNC